MASNVVTSIHVSNSVQDAFDKFFGYLPNILGFLVILVITYLIAKFLKGLVNKGLEKLHLDDVLTRSSVGDQVEKVSPGGRPSRFIGAIVFWFIFIYGLTAAIAALKIPSVTLFMNKVLAYLPNVVAAVIIFVVAAGFSGVVAAAAKKTMGDTPTGKLAETVIPGLIMAVAVFMILTQLKIAPTIVTITYAALLGMLALTGALAFGLGGRDVASRVWSDAYDRSQAAKNQAMQDVQTGKQRAQEQAPSAATGATHLQPPPSPAS